MDVLTLRGVLTLDKSQYDKGLADADTGARSFGGRFSKAAKVGVAAAAALGVAAGYAGKKIVDGAKQVAEYGDNVDKMSQKLGLSTDGFQKWDYVLKIAGTDINSMQTGLKTLTNKIDDAKNGSSDAQEKFAKLGISMDELNKMSREEAFEAVIKGFQGMGDSTERAALANDLFGKSGQNLTPLFNQTAEATEEQLQLAEKYGMVMPEAAVKASAAFQDSMTTLQMTAQGLKNRLLGEFLPAMTKVTDGLALMFTGDMSGLDDVIDGVKDFIGKIGELAPKVLEAGGKLLLELVKGLVEKIPELLATGGEMLGKLLEGLQNSLSNAAPVIANIVTAIGQFITTNAPKLIQTALTLIQALAQGLIQAIPSLVASIPQLISSIINTFMGVDWAGLGASLLKMIGSGIASAGGQAKEKVRAIVDSIRQKMSDTWNGIKSTASKVWNRIKSAITKPIESAKNTVKKAINKIKGFFPLKIGKIFSGLKLPHFNISGGKAPFGIGGLGTKPKISVSWYKKAEETPYLFSNATLFGAGEGSQDEMLYGKKALMRDIKDAVGGTGTYNYTFNVYATESQSPKEIAEAVRQMIIKEEKRRKVAWA